VLQWNDRSRTLSISDREGSFPGMVSEREFRVVLATDAAAAGIAEPTSAAVRTVTYRGKALSVTF
jgi:alpha-D-xyloside xylohydrolase